MINNKIEVKEPLKGKEKEVKAPKNYKGMDNKMTPGGSFFEEIIPAPGVNVKEGTKNKGGKKVNKGTTRTEYFMSNSKSMMTLPSIAKNKITINDFQDIKPNDTFETSSILQSIGTEVGTPKINLTHNMLPPIENSRFSLNSTKNIKTKNLSFSQPKKSENKISIKDTSNDFIEQSLIIKTTKFDRLMGTSKSAMLLMSSLPDK